MEFKLASLAIKASSAYIVFWMAVKVRFLFAYYSWKVSLLSHWSGPLTFPQKWNLKFLKVNFENVWKPNFKLVDILAPTHGIFTKIYGNHYVSFGYLEVTIEQICITDFERIVMLCFILRQLPPNFSKNGKQFRDMVKIFSNNKFYYN